MMESKPITYQNGDTYWQFPDGSIHREDGPAVIYNTGTQFWYKYDKRHRLNGPAIIYTNGTKQWWINDYPVTEQIHQWAKEMDIDLDNLSDEDKFMIRLYWENYNGED